MNFLKTHLDWQVLLQRFFNTLPPEEFWAVLSAMELRRALIFFVIGVTRVTEFQGLGLSRLRIRVLSVFHVIGCVLLTAQPSSYCV